MSRGIAFIACFLCFFISHHFATCQESASIAATATVMNPAGFKTVSESSLSEDTNGMAGVIFQNRFIEKVMIDASFGSKHLKTKQRPVNTWPGNDNVNTEYYDNWLIQKTVNNDLNARSITLTLVCIGN
jgi:hypothetical protein